MPTKHNHNNNRNSCTYTGYIQQKRLNPLYLGKVAVVNVGRKKQSCGCLVLGTHQLPEPRGNIQLCDNSLATFPAWLSTKSTISCFKNFNVALFFILFFVVTKFINPYTTQCNAGSSHQRVLPFTQYSHLHHLESSLTMTSQYCRHRVESKIAVTD